MIKAIRISQFQMNSAMIFTMISIVILFISFITAEYVYSSNTLIPYSVIFVSTFVGLEVLLYLFVVPLSELVDSWDKKRKRLTATKSFVANLPVGESPEIETPTVVPNVEASTASKEADTPMTTEPEKRAGSVAPETIVHSLISQVTSTEVIPVEKPVAEDIQAIYSRSDAEMRVVEAGIKEKKKELIRIYIGEVMAPLLEEEDIRVFWMEFESWIDHSAYHPKGRYWKWKKEVKPVDARHLVWNIAKRLGMNKGYDTETCAEFIKNMFPDVCKEVKKSTLSQTLTADPDKGYIKLDKPDKNSFAFHN